MSLSGQILEFQPSNDDLRQLREWIAKTPYIIQDYDEEFLKAIARKCKGSLQKTKAVLENLNSLGLRHSDFFGHFNISNNITMEQLHSTHMFVIPERLDDGSLIYVFRLNLENSDAYKFHLFEAHRYLLMSFYVLVWEKMFGSGKITIVFDWKNITPVHMRGATPTYIKKSAEIRGQNYPFRIQAIHHVNVPSVVEWVVNMLGSFMNKKLLQRIHVHKTMESLHGYIPAKLLPKEYGGDLESSAILHGRWKKTVESYKNELTEESGKMRSLDSLRPKTDDVSIMEGSFRTLKVD